MHTQHTHKIDKRPRRWPDSKVVHWAMHNGQVSACRIRRGEAWQAENGRIAATRSFTYARLRVESDIPRGQTPIIHRFTHSSPQMVNCHHCQKEMQHVHLWGPQTQETGPPFDCNCSTIESEYSSSASYICPRCKDVEYPSNSGAGWIKNLLNGERQDLALLPYHYPIVPDLI